MAVVGLDLAVEGFAASLMLGSFDAGLPRISRLGYGVFRAPASPDVADEGRGIAWQRSMASSAVRDMALTVLAPRASSGQRIRKSPLRRGR